MAAPINFFVYSLINQNSVSHSIGMPEYSYFFVLEDFLPLLQRVGRVHRLSDPINEVDALYDCLSAKGERCVFLNFTAPQNMLAGIRCPTIHVFAWEYSSMPTETWLDERLQDWRVALSAHKAAITHSNYAVRSIKDAMGEDFLVVAIPCPVWDKFEAERAAIGQRAAVKAATLDLEGRIFDSRRFALLPDRNALSLTMSLFPDYRSFETYREEALRLGSEMAGSGGEDAEPNGRPAETQSATSGGSPGSAAVKGLIRDLTPPMLWKFVRGHRAAGHASPGANATEKWPSDSLPAEEVDLFSRPQPQRLELRGVVYTSIFNPLDERKNWHDMVSAFIWAHKENKDATLVLKTPKLDVHDFVDLLIVFLKRFAPFDCRIVVLMCYLDDAQYKELLEATTYYVNTSYGEGQCLPLMEYLSAGVPAVAPNSTALADYMEPGMSFVVPSHEEPTNWQHDPRMSFRALRYKVDWLRLVEAYEQSYELAKTKPDAWRAMGRAAAERLKSHCSLATAEGRLRNFLDRARQLWRENPVSPIEAPAENGKRRLRNEKFI